MPFLHSQKTCWWAWSTTKNKQCSNWVGGEWWRLENRWNRTSEYSHCHRSMPMLWCTTNSYWLAKLSINWANHLSWTQSLMKKSSKFMQVERHCRMLWLISLATLSSGKGSKISYRSIDVGKCQCGKRWSHKKNRIKSRKKIAKFETKKDFIA